MEKTLPYGWMMALVMAMNRLTSTELKLIQEIRAVEARLQ
jgi:hypothetical protein